MTQHNLSLTLVPISFSLIRGHPILQVPIRSPTVQAALCAYHSSYPTLWKPQCISSLLQQNTVATLLSLTISSRTASLRPTPCSQQTTWGSHVLLFTVTRPRVHTIRMRLSPPVLLASTRCENMLYSMLSHIYFYPRTVHVQARDPDVDARPRVQLVQPAVRARLCT